jgi:hypothetical protein
MVGAVGLLEKRRPAIHLMVRSPGHEQVLAPRIFHFQRHAIVARVFHLRHHAIEQAFAAMVFHLNHHATEQAPAAQVFHLNRHDSIPGVFHLNHHFIGQDLEPDCIFSELR